MPQKPVRPKPPVCGCKKKKCCKKDCCENDFVFRKVVIPVALGDDETGKAKPENGAYTNSYVEYEANGAQYMYDSYGVYTKIEGGGGGEGTRDFNQLDNRPKYAGEEMTGETSIPDVATAVANEASLRAAADAALQGDINGLANRVTTAEGEITTIEGKIPEQASATNQLADKNFVNSSIATNTANFIGTFNSVAELEAYSGTVTNSDYAFVIVTDTAGNTAYDRYKYNGDTEQWLFEYELNNSSFTANQWAAINSGITSGDVTKLSDLANIKTIGNNLTLDANGELSATDTVYNDFTGTDGVNAGTSGLVPAPAVSDAGKYLKADGTWGTVSGGIPTNATFWGRSYDSGSNKVSGSIYGQLTSGSMFIVRGSSISDRTAYLQLSSGSVSLYYNGSSSSGFWIDSSGMNITNIPGINLSSGASNPTQYKKIFNMADPTAAQDAATKNYVDTQITTTKNYVDTQIAGTTETLTIATTDWTALSASDPYDYSATVTATTTISATSTVELINDQAVLFGTYGFAIGSVDTTNNTLTIYSIGQPSASVSLTIKVRS